MKSKYILEIFIYLVVILLISWFFLWYCKYLPMHPSSEVASTTIAAITGYSFTALFFLMALPRTGFIKEIDRNGSLIFYGSIIGFPAIIGTLQLILASIGWFPNIALFLFFMASFGFIVSIIFIFLILAKNRNSKKSTHRSV